MILVDTSVWVDHLRVGDSALVKLLESGRVLAHPFVIGELALGNLQRREAILGSLADLPRADVVTDQEALHFIEQHGLAGLGIGYIDAHLLASTRLSSAASFWTRDKRLSRVAEQLALTSRTSA